MNSLRRFLVVLSASLSLIGCSDKDRDTIPASGTIEGTHVNIGSEVVGRVRAVRVGEGARVERGDTLVVIDDTEYQIQLRQATANLTASDAQYRLVVEGARREDVLQAEVAYKTAEADYQRMKDLLATGTVSQKQHDDAYARYVAAQQTYEKLVRGSRNMEIVAARARAELAQAQVDLLRKKVNDCHILAPTGGLVTLRAIEPGELVSPGSNLMRITHLDEVELTIFVNEVDLGRVKVGQKAEVMIDAFEDRTFAGRVSSISPVAEFTPKNVQTKEERSKLVFAVKLRVANPDGVLKPGLPAEARVFTGSETVK